MNLVKYSISNGSRIVDLHLMNHFDRLIIMKAIKDRTLVVIQFY